MAPLLGLIKRNHLGTSDAVCGRRPPHHCNSTVIQFLQPCSQARIISFITLIAHHASRRSNRFTRPPLADLVILYEVHHSFPLGCGRHHFFELISFNIKLSSMLSIARRRFAFKPREGASSFFSLAFSSSSCFSLRASLTSIPPRRAFHLKNLALPMACLRHKSATVMPLSYSRDIPIICSSLNLLCFIVFSLKTGSDSTHFWINLQGSGHNLYTK